MGVRSSRGGWKHRSARARPFLASSRSAPPRTNKEHSMSITTLRTLVLGAASAALAGLLVAPVSASASSPWLDQVRDATRQYTSVHHAKKDGYAKFLDA